MTLDDAIHRETNRVMRRHLFRAPRVENTQIDLLTFDGLVREIVAWAELLPPERDARTRHVSRRVLDMP